MVRITLSLVILILAAPLLAQGDPPTEPPASHEILAQGLSVYKQFYCGVCHQLEVKALLASLIW